MNIRVRGLEDAARLAMGDYAMNESTPASGRMQTPLWLAMIAGAALLVAVAAFALL